MNINKFSNIIKDNNLNEEEKLQAFGDFYIYYSNLLKKVLKNRTFTERQLSVDIFLKKWPDKKSETVFKKQFYSSFKTLERIKIGIETGIVNKFNIGISKSSINNFADILFIFSYDVYELVKYAESKYNNHILNYRMGSAIGSSSRDIFENGTIILHIKHFGTNSIHYRDFFSYTVFTIRLMIEVAGKKIMGFNSITDDKGERLKKIKTQIAWEFIKNDQLNNKRIQLPMEIDTILEIEKWTNQFVHTGYIQPIFLVENALVFLDKLIIPKSTKISNYNDLKLEFENYVKSKVNEGQIIQVNWMNEKHLESEIISK
ncbi:hypothetical protein [Flavobacterium sp. JAS]|uniref:hypothetical protein n=1 Tax=Flavobacterium sp. JAS TaxID=2897329 RepID=UPI001E41336C|nr:hypothetical protein [Flavobacterium sp. JAS]MCD0472573.1 hypothetical protein [Flavobacterium sp. JAS]